MAYIIAGLSPAGEVGALAATSRHSAGQNSMRPTVLRFSIGMGGILARHDHARPCPLACSWLHAATCCASVTAGRHERTRPAASRHTSQFHMGAYGKVGRTGYLEAKPPSPPATLAHPPPSIIAHAQSGLSAAISTFWPRRLSCHAASPHLQLLAMADFLALAASLPAAASARGDASINAAFVAASGALTAGRCSSRRFQSADIMCHIFGHLSTPMLQPANNLDAPNAIILSMAAPAF